MVGIIASKIGIQHHPYGGSHCAASLGTAAALQGMLVNYAAGVTIIVTRPFVVETLSKSKGKACR